MKSTNEENKMKTVVITGSTKGIGFGLAEAFLAKGCRVVINGRTDENVQQACKKLRENFDALQVFGVPCDISDFDQVEALWKAAVGRFKKVDIWVNNAGQAQAIQDFWTLNPEQIRTVVETNIIGTMNGTKVAIQHMLKQGHGAVYNMEGAGSTGRLHVGMLLYASTKRGLNYLLNGLAHELDGKPVIIGGLSPGMVVTDLLLDQKEGDPEEWERTKKVFNIMADKVETVCPWLVDQMLKNEKNGANLSWSSTAKILWRFLTSPFKKRDLFEE
jgi:NAD(P)-dependent dehydrogenase (short-subunit alcohol dehydrogenase family)